MTPPVLNAFELAKLRPRAVPDSEKPLTQQKLNEQKRRENERTKSGTDAWNQRAKEAGLLEYLIAQLRAGRVSVEDLPARWQGDAAHSSDLASIFTGLSSRGLAKSRAKKAAEAHPRAAQIAYVQDNFLDIMTELEDSGIVKINCD